MKGPKQKYDKDMIREMGIKFIDDYGISKFSARRFSKFIGCSTQPFFSLYNGMDKMLLDIRNGIYKYYCDYYESYMKNYEPPFLGMGMGYINFARFHPNLFQYLFLDKHFKKSNFGNFFEDEEAIEFLYSLSTELKITIHEARSLLRQLWLICHGMATLLYTEQVEYNENEVREILIQEFMGSLNYLRGKK